MLQNAIVNYLAGDFDTYYKLPRRLQIAFTEALQIMEFGIEAEKIELNKKFEALP